jgi:hypothetical protein
MKKLIFFALVLYSVQKVYGGDTLYYPILKKSIDLAYKEYKLENYMQLANCSERIISVYKNDWLPYYYYIYACVNMSFIETKEEDKEKYCERAQNQLDEVLKNNPGESELFVLQSLICYGRMSINPMINGPLYITKAANALNEAEKLDPGNPRIYYLRGKSTINTPKFFGGGKSAAIPFFEKALNIYKTFKPKSTIYPDWGKEDAERLYEECKKDSI